MLSPGYFLGRQVAVEIRTLIVLNQITLMYGMWVVNISMNFWSHMRVALYDSCWERAKRNNLPSPLRSTCKAECSFLLLCIPLLLSPGFSPAQGAEALLQVLSWTHTPSFLFYLFFFLCICSNSKLGLQTSVNKSFELRQLFLEANYCVLVNEPGRRNVKYIRLAATSLLSKGIILTSP